MEEADVYSKKRTVAFQGERQINANPHGQPVLYGQIERLDEARTHVEQPRRAFRHQRECLESLLRRNLFPAITLRHQACEFRQEKIGAISSTSPETYCSNHPRAGARCGSGSIHFAATLQVQNERVRHPLSLPVRANQRRAVTERRQGGGKPVQFLPQVAQLPPPLGFGCFCFQHLDNL